MTTRLDAEEPKISQRPSRETSTPGSLISRPDKMGFRVSGAEFRLSRQVSGRKTERRGHWAGTRDIVVRQRHDVLLRQRHAVFQPIPGDREGDQDRQTNQQDDDAGKRAGPALNVAICRPVIVCRGFRHAYLGARVKSRPRRLQYPASRFR